MIGRFPLDIMSKTTYPPISKNFLLGIAVDSANNRFGIVNYRADGAINNILFYHTETYQLIQSIDVTGSKGALEHDAVGNRFFLGHNNDDGKLFSIISGVDYSITTIDTPSSDSILAPVVRGFAIDSTNDKLFVSAYFTQSIARIYVFKLSDLTFITSYPVSQCVGIYVDIPNNELFICRHSSGKVDVYNSLTNDFKRSITGFSNAYSIVVDPANSDLLIVVDNADNSLRLLKKSTNTILGKYEGIVSPRFSAFYNGKIMTTQTNGKITVIERFY